MIACLRAAKFRFLDDTGSVFVEMRRRNDKFIVSERIPSLNMVRNINKGTYNEASVEWNALVLKHEDSGMRRCDPVIKGFHEEG